MFDLKKNSDWSFEEQKSSMLEYFRIESLKKKTQPLKSKRRSRTKESIKRAKRELKRNRHRGVHDHYLSPMGGKEGGRGSGGFCLCNDKFT